MADNADTGAGTMGPRLLDDAYLAWLCAEAESEIALRAWSEALGPGRAGAYAAYRAALDREEAAALDLQRLAWVPEPCQPTAIVGATVRCD